MFERTLIPLDGSPEAESVLPHMSKFIRKSGSELVLFRAFHAEPLLARMDTASLIERDLLEARKYIDGLVRRLAGEGLPVRGRVVQGSPAEAILRTASEERVTTIALSTHGRTGIGRWVLGSVAEEVVRASTVPVFVLRSTAAVPVRTGIRRILVPLDGSATAFSAAPFAAELARSVGAEMMVLHVHQRMLAHAPSFAWSWVETAPTPSDADPYKVAKAAVEDLAVGGLKVTPLTVEGDPATRILESSFKEDIDLVVMATHGRDGLPRLFLGSVAEKVLRRTAVPMILIRPDKLEETHAWSGT